MARGPSLGRGCLVIRLFRITNPASGVNLGTYAGKTKAAALDNYATRAGYDSFKAACEVTGDDAEDDAGLSVVEVEAERLPSFSFDGFGINGPDEYRTRIATFDRRNMSETDRNKWGRLFAAAPDLLAALRALVARCDTTELADGSSIDTLAATMAIRLAEGGE